MDRRTFLASLAGSTPVVLAGCSGDGSSGNGAIVRTRETASPTEGATPTGQPASPTATGTPTGTDAPSIDELPDLEGDLTVYLGRGEGGAYSQLVEYLEKKRYPDFSVSLRRGPSAGLANTIVTEAKHGESPADVFWSIDAASLGFVAQAGLARPLPKDVTEVVPEQFSDDQRRWVGISGRARSIPYNTNELSEDEIPNSVFGLPDGSRFDDALGWAPSYGSFQAFVTAMRLLSGAERTRSWLEAMQKSGVRSFAGEFGVTYAVAQGTLEAGLANHYYALRLKAGNPDAPVGLAFTNEGPGSLVNVAGALVLESTEQPSLATNFVRHFLTPEVQEYLVTNVYSYPLVPGVQPPAVETIDLPPIRELNPPNLDLTRLAHLQPTLELLRETGVL